MSANKVRQADPTFYRLELVSRFKLLAHRLAGVFYRFLRGLRR